MTKGAEILISAPFLSI